MEYKLIFNEETKPVEIENEGGNGLKAVIDDTTYDVAYSLISDHQIHLTINGKGVNAFVADGPDGKSIIINGTSYLIQDADLLAQSSSRKKGGSALPTEITPVTPSVVISVLVKEGDKVEKGQGIVVLSAMKMETTLSSAFSGTVTSVNTEDGANVSPGDILVDIEFDEVPVEETEKN